MKDDKALAKQNYEKVMELLPNPIVKRNSRRWKRNNDLD